MTPYDINSNRQRQASVAPRVDFTKSNGLISNLAGIKNNPVAPSSAAISTSGTNMDTSNIAKMASDTVAKNTTPAVKKSFANTKVGGFLNSGAASAITSGLNMAQQVLHSNRTGLQKTDEGSLAIRDAQYDVLEKIPITAPFAKAARMVDGALGVITGGLGSATEVDKFLTKIPLLGNTAAIFAGKTDTFKGDIQDINTGDFGGVVADANRAKDLSGVKSVAKGRLNRQIRSAQQDYLETAMKVDRNNKLLNNSIGDSLFSMNQSKYYPGNQQIMLSKKGTKFPELDAMRSILESSKVKTFKSGGKIEKENIIPTGALHKNLHHIDDIGIDITKKGIPVVTMNEGGEFKEQIAEVEAAEWTLSLDVTKQIEEYWKNYKESGDDNMAIECGKYLVDQIFNNTRDDDKVIKNTNE